ncbi:uncharacterized protein LOC132559613 [Ylistrum balloti]|uniref:uncharacterized protein LOC132559613 n=1 Tax=Ylistrum balloti TaxID=509963 RepID=UPI00290583B2|nr:uncharacterized protein LOC132559613 [Ylistrum balloti]
MSYPNLFLFYLDLQKKSDKVGQSWKSDSTVKLCFNEHGGLEVFARHEISAQISQNNDVLPGASRHLLDLHRRLKSMENWFKDIEKSMKDFKNIFDNLKNLHSTEEKRLNELENLVNKEQLRIDDQDKNQLLSQRRLADLENKQQTDRRDIIALREQRATDKQALEEFVKRRTSDLDKIAELTSLRLVDQYRISELVSMRQNEQRRLSNLEKQINLYQEKFVKFEEQQKRDEERISVIEKYDKLNRRVSDISKQRQDDERRISVTEKYLKGEKHQLSILRKYLKENQLSIAELKKRRITTKYAIADLENQDYFVQRRIVQLTKQQEINIQRLDVLEHLQRARRQQKSFTGPVGLTRKKYLLPGKSSSAVSGNYTRRFSVGKEDDEFSLRYDNDTFAFHAVHTKEKGNTLRFSVIQFDDVITNIGGAFNPISSQFTCPVNGIYVFGWTVRVSQQYLCTDLVKNGNVVATAFSGGENIGDVSVSGSSLTVVELQEGDRVWVRNKKNNKVKVSILLELQV